MNFQDGHQDFNNV